MIAHCQVIPRYDIQNHQPTRRNAIKVAVKRTKRRRTDGTWIERRPRDPHRDAMPPHLRLRRSLGPGKGWRRSLEGVLNAHGGGGARKRRKGNKNPNLDGPDHLMDDPTNDVACENRVYDMEFSWPSDHCLGALIIIKVF